MSVEVITVSSKGQIALPAEMRKRMSINKGDKFAAYEDGNVIMLKPLKLPTEDDFKAWLSEAQEWATSVDLTENDIDEAINSVRGRKRK